MAKKKVTRKKKAAAAVKKPPTKSEIFSQIADSTELAKRDVAAVFDALQPIIKKSLKQTGAFSMPGLCKVVVKKKPATKARKGINPFTGEEMMFKAKPASKTVRIRPLKNLKDML